MIGFNQKNIVDIDSNNKQTVGFNKISHPYEQLVKKGTIPIDLWNFQQRCEKLEKEGFLTNGNDDKKQFMKYEDLKLPEIMPYRNHTPPYQKERYKQNMKMKSLDTILKYKRDHEKGSIFQMQAYDKPVRFYKEQYNGDSKIGKLQQIQQSYQSQYDQPTPQAQFQSNIPQYYSQKNITQTNSPLKNIQIQNSHQYKVIASENEQNVNYKVYNNDYPQVVEQIKKQYEYQKEQISREPSFFQKRKAVDYYYPPLATQQYDPPKKYQEEQQNFQFMQPVIPVFVPVNDKLPDQYMITLPQIPQYQQDLTNSTTPQTQTIQTKNLITQQYMDSNELQPGQFANGQNFNRFTDPKAERYEQKNRHESMNKRYRPDLLPRGDKAGYNMNPHTTAVNVKYQRQEKQLQDEKERVVTENIKHLQDFQKSQLLLEEQQKSLKKIFN